MAISADTVLNDGSTLLVLGDYKTIQKCFHILKIVGDDNGKGNSDIDCMCNIWTGTFYGVKTGMLY